MESTIFVAPDGCDTKGDGSIDRPFQTLAHSQSVVKPGQTVCFREGVYLIELTDDGVIYSKGTPDAWITFKNYNDEKVVFDGDGRGMLISSFSSLITLYRAQYVIFDGFEVRNTWKAGITNFDSFHTIVRNCKVHNTHSRGIGGNGQYLTYEYNEVFHTCMANENGKAGGWSSALATINRPGFVPTSNVIMRHNNVYESWGEGINSFNATNVVMDSNIAKDCYSVNMYCDTSTNVTIINNYVESKNSHYFRNGYAATAIQYSSEGSSTTVRIKPYPCADNIFIKGNTIDGADEGIVYWEDKMNTWESNTYRNIEISGNILKNIASYDIHINRVSMPGVAPPYNVKMFDNKLSAPNLSERIFVGDAELWEMYNNEFQTSTV